MRSLAARVGVDRLEQLLNQASSIARSRPVEWKQAVGSPYSAEKNDSKYAASAIESHVSRIQAASACSWLQRTKSPCCTLPATGGLAPIVRPMRQPRSARYIR